MDLKEIYGLWDRFDASQATEFELEMSGVHVHLKRDNGQCASVINSVPNSNVVNVVNVDDKPANETSDDSLIKIKAPLVGTFYQSQAPGAEPFIKVGQKVSKGDVIGIIEAMKLMNEITAPSDGVVEEILVNDSSMVEYDQVLVTLR